MRNAALPLAFVLLASLAVVSPAVATTSTGPSSSISAARVLPTDSPGPAAAENRTTNGDPGISGVTLFTVSDPDTAPPVSIGFAAKPGADGFFVLQDQNGTVLGTSEYQSFENAIHADGMAIPFDEPVYGIRTISVTAYHDTNGNRAFDPGVDEPYRTGDGSPVSDSMAFLFPRTEGALSNVSATLVPETGGERAVHHYRIGVDETNLEGGETMLVDAIALDYDYPVDPETIDPGSVTLKAGTRVDPVAVNATVRGQVAVIEFADPVPLSSGDDAILTVSAVPNPTRPANVTVVLNPYGAAHAGVAHLEPSRPVPELQQVTVGPFGQTVSVNAYFPQGSTAVVVITRNGTEIARSQPIGGQPDMHVDFLEIGLEKPVHTGETLTVGLLRDADGDGTYEVPVRYGKEAVAKQVTVPAVTTTTTIRTTLRDTPTTDRRTPTTSTTTPPTDTTGTRTTTPGFGVGLAVASLVAVGALLHRRNAG
ncbi:MAG: PGF-CTERM sorting domain-containing protein [Halodesulfurarchaeum sp.]